MMEDDEEDDNNIDSDEIEDVARNYNNKNKQIPRNKSGNNIDRDKSPDNRNEGPYNPEQTSNSDVSSERSGS